MTMIQGGDLDLSQTLGQSENACIHHPDFKVRIGALQGETAMKVIEAWWNNLIRPAQNILQEAAPNSS